MPHIIVDGYNVIRRIPSFLVAERDGLESGRDALLMAIEDYAAAFGYMVTVVFDAGGRPRHIDAAAGRGERFAGIDIVFSERGESADTAIARLLDERKKAKSDGSAACDDAQIVISDDFGLRDDAIERGAFVKSSKDLFDAMIEKKPLSF